MLDVLYVMKTTLTKWQACLPLQEAATLAIEVRIKDTTDSKTHDPCLQYYVRSKIQYVSKFERHNMFDLRRYS